MSDTPNVDELTYGIDMGAPNGDKTAISIKDGNTMHVFVGAEAEVIIKLITQAKQQACDDIVGLLPSDSVVTKEYGYHSDEKKYGFRIGITATIEAIKQYREGL